VEEGNVLITSANRKSYMTTANKPMFETHELISLINPWPAVLSSIFPREFRDFKSVSVSNPNVISRTSRTPETYPKLHNLLGHGCAVNKDPN
jgi:hypothetical protein